MRGVGHFNVNRGYTSNGSNQLAASSGVSFSHDSRGNLTASGTDSSDILWRICCLQFCSRPDANCCPWPGRHLTGVVRVRTLQRLRWNQRARSSFPPRSERGAGARAALVKFLASRLYFDTNMSCFLHLSARSAEFLRLWPPGPLLWLVTAGTGGLLILFPR